MVFEIVFVRDAGERDCGVWNDRASLVSNGPTHGSRAGLRPGSGGHHEREKNTKTELTQPRVFRHESPPAKKMLTSYGSLTNGGAHLRSGIGAAAADITSAIHAHSNYSRSRWSGR